MGIPRVSRAVEEQTAGCCAPATRWTATTPSRSTCRARPASRTCPRRTSSARSGRRSARRRTATCSAAASNARCSCCATTDRSVTDICLDVGFTSLGTFSRTFREIVGESPSAYRAARARCPAGADVLHDGLDATEQFRRSRPAAAGVDRVGAHAHARSPITLTVYVLDQDEALDFYVGKLGLEVNADADLGFMRWLTVSVPGDPTARSCSSCPARRRWTRRPPSRSASWSPRARSAAGSASRPTTAADLRRRCAAEGVEFTQEPVERPYGTDFGLRDPFGNQIRIGQVTGG